MQKFPEALFAMSKRGVDESVIQEIFDLMLEAENNGKAFLNIYDPEGENPGFHASDDRESADDQLARYRQTGKPVMGFVFESNTWNER